MKQESIIDFTKPVGYLLKEIESTIAVAQTSSLWSEEEAILYTEEYFIKNLFTTIYKYVMGVYKLYHFDGSTYQDLCKCVFYIMNHLSRKTRKSINKLYEQFPTVKNVELIKDFIDNLKFKLETFKKTKEIYKIEGENLEEEELSRPGYYRFRRYCVIVLSSIEN